MKYDYDRESLIRYLYTMGLFSVPVFAVAGIFIVEAIEKRSEEE